MTRAFALPASPAFTNLSIIVAATRGWRSARDIGRPVLTALYETLGAHRAGILAPAFASLMALYESCAGRPIRVGGPHPASLSSDEHHLFRLLDGSRDSRTMMADAADSGLVRPMRIAIRSTRILMRLALESASDLPSSPGRIFTGPVGSGAR